MCEERIVAAFLEGCESIIPKAPIAPVMHIDDGFIVCQERGTISVPAAHKGVVVGNFEPEPKILIHPQVRAPPGKVCSVLENVLRHTLDLIFLF